MTSEYNDKYHYDATNGKSDRIIFLFIHHKKNK